MWYCQPSPPSRRNWIPCNGSHGTCHIPGQYYAHADRKHVKHTFTTLISNRTARELAPMVSKMAGSISPVGSGEEGTRLGLAGAKSCGMGGSVLPFAGDAERGASSGAARFSRVPEPAASTVAVWVAGETWKKEDDALLAVVLSVVAPEGRLGSSLSFDGSRSLFRMPKERFEAFFVIVRCLSSYELVDGRFVWAGAGG